MINVFHNFWVKFVGLEASLFPEVTTGPTLGETDVQNRQSVFPPAGGANLTAFPQESVSCQNRATHNAAAC